MAKHEENTGGTAVMPHLRDEGAERDTALMGSSPQLADPIPVSAVQDEEGVKKLYVPDFPVKNVSQIGGEAGHGAGLAMNRRHDLAPSQMRGPSSGYVTQRAKPLSENIAKKREQGDTSKAESDELRATRFRGPRTAGLEEKKAYQNRNPQTEGGEGTGAGVTNSMSEKFYGKGEFADMAQERGIAAEAVTAALDGGELAGKPTDGSVRYKIPAADGDAWLDAQAQKGGQ